ncbi:hypothetical protein ACFQUX_18670 [Pantoea stewartii]
MGNVRLAIVPLRTGGNDLSLQRKREQRCTEKVTFTVSCSPGATERVFAVPGATMILR